MKKNGFTLVELLAVIVILAILALVVTITTRNTINTSKNKLSQIQIQKIEEAAKIYYLNEGINEAFYNLEESKTCVNLSYLTENGYIEEIEIKNPKDDSDISGSVKITYKSKKYKYEYQDNECSPSDYFVSLDAVCDLVSDADDSNSITIGDKYQCKVKDKMEKGFENGYYFYVLSHNNDGTVNLIMDQNINSNGTPAGMIGVTKDGENVYNLVAWNNEIGQSTNAYGPVTAMQFLYNATKDWINVNLLNYTYNDKDMQETMVENTSYVSFVSINGVAEITTIDGTKTIIGTDEEPLRARMPIYSSDITVTEALDRTDVTSYLYINLNSSSSPYGYWTLSSLTDDNTEARSLYYSGISSDPVSLDSSMGVRPVITLEI